MRVTRLGKLFPVVSTASLGSGGGTIDGSLGGTGYPGAGSVPTATGSNTWAWASNIGSITVNGTTKVLGPHVNFANGSNTTVTVDMVGAAPSNTIRIHATGGGAVSFGSNATHVAEISAGGASTDSARMDHYHAGIATITASSSNTMQRGTWNLRPGAGIALALTDTDGDGEFDTTTIVNTGQGGGGSGSAWTLSIDQSGSSIANWTARDGTWASTSGEIRQTNTGAAEYHLHYTNTLPTMAHVLAQAELWIPSANSTDDYIGLDIGTTSNNASGTGIRVYLKRSGTSLIVATTQSGAESASATVTVNTDTWYTVRALVSGYRVTVWLDGTFKYTANVSPTSLTDATYFGLFTSLSTGHFRNVKVWTLTLPS